MKRLVGVQLQRMKTARKRYAKRLNEQAQLDMSRLSKHAKPMTAFEDAFQKMLGAENGETVEQEIARFRKAKANGLFKHLFNQPESGDYNAETTDQSSLTT